MQAKELTNKDIIGKSDPFAVLYMHPLPGRMKTAKTKTRVILEGVYKDCFVLDEAKSGKLNLHLKWVPQSGKLNLHLKWVPQPIYHDYGVILVFLAYGES
ncbi:C2 domain-containing protein [Cephalotus follicularis]|uniref:C2 domain-containing protein n=1 Tax=Cephalotus follicularis TaxID=3775 RepID=A0A1Q3CW17_CEPFO|nr:C2 domain-containing protein [Cephalotus follicularis]